MGKKDPRIDTYIEKSTANTKNILKRMRKMINAGRFGAKPHKKELTVNSATQPM